MAVVGNAKNARMVVEGADVGGAWLIMATIRGSKYEVYISDGSGWGNTAYIKKLPSTLLGSKSTWSGLSTIEAVDNRLRMWKGADTWENTPANVRIEAFDSTHLVSGAWELTQGTLVSFTNLDMSHKMYIGSQAVSKMYVGSQEVQRAYAHGELVWEA